MDLRDLLIRIEVLEHNVEQLRIVLAKVGDLFTQPAKKVKPKKGECK